MPRGLDEAGDMFRYAIYYLGISNAASHLKFLLEIVLPKFLEIF